MSVGDWSGTSLDWLKALDVWKERMGSVFPRRELRETACLFLDGLLSAIERKTGWMLAEQAGLDRHYRVQSLLGRGRRDADDLKDCVREYVVECLRDDAAVLVLDETGFLKKGDKSVGVSRQYSGAAGRMEDCQIEVFAAYASRYGHSLIDRRLYLPRQWADDPERCAAVAVPPSVSFATKPAIAAEMIARILDAGTPCARVLADSVHGSVSSLRRMLENRGRAYALAVTSSHHLRFLTEDGLVQTNPAGLAALAPDTAWETLAAGEGTKGIRFHRWARVALGRTCAEGWAKWVLIRRDRADPSRQACYPVQAKADTTLADMAGAAGQRWAIEECFLRAKDDLGLDHCEARSWHGWHRHISLCMAAAAFLAKLSADLRRQQTGKPNKIRPHKTSLNKTSLPTLKADTMVA